MNQAKHIKRIEEAIAVLREAMPVCLRVPSESNDVDEYFGVWDADVEDVLEMLIGNYEAKIQNIRNPPKPRLPPPPPRHPAITAQYGDAWLCAITKDTMKTKLTYGEPYLANEPQEVV